MPSYSVNVVVDVEAADVFDAEDIVSAALETAKLGGTVYAISALPLDDAEPSQPSA